MKQVQALEILKTGRNVFVTGPAGSGKTHLVNSYITYLRHHGVDVGITASTGIAATHMGGVTIHSWAGIGVHTFLSEEDLEAMAEKPYLSKRFERVKVLIIDEVSMLHHFRLDLVDQVMKSMKGNSEPFGGVQMVLCGDFFQLPPVNRMDEPESHFIYHSEAWKNGGFTVCYLEEQFRQKDNVVLTILNEIRSGEVSQKSRELLQTRLYKKVDISKHSIEPTKLFTHNIDVDALNLRELEKLHSDEQAEHRMDSTGRDVLVEILKKSCLAQPVLKLKVGARVMCVKNNFEAGYVNGTLGVVISCKQSQPPVIRLANGKIITMERASWKIEEDDRVKAEISQYPLRLAWAITVHKSQGMSLDAVEVDLTKAFETGMGYVALSRVRTLEGLTILGLNEKALEVNSEVLEYDSELRLLSLQAEKMLEKTGVKKIKKDQVEYLAYITPKKKSEKVASHEITAELVTKRMSLKDMAKARGMTTETIIEHIEKCLQEEGGEPVDIAYLKKEISRPHWLKIEKAFNELLEKDQEIHLAPVKNKVGANVSYLHIRLARAIKRLVP